MYKADLHVHSKYSAHPSEWFLQRLGARESYTEPEEIYRAAKAAGMSIVTITDHNRIDGALELKRAHPDDVVTGLEATAYFPEDGCKVHVLVYGLDERQFAKIEELRASVYDLRDYLRTQNLACAVAHATFSVNRRLTLSHVERLMLLFDHFEGINGARAPQANIPLNSVLCSLTQQHMCRLLDRHRIEPWSAEPWRKGVIGGSDDHSGLSIGRTYTLAEGNVTPVGMLEALRAKQTFPGGRHNDYRTFAFSIYRIAYGFSKERHNSLPPGLLGSLNRLLFEGGRLDFGSRLALTRLRMRKPTSDLQLMVRELVEEFERLRGAPTDEKINRVYDQLARISDQLLTTMLPEIARGVSTGDFAGVVRTISSLIPAVFLALPFFTTLNVLSESRHLTEEMCRAFDRRRPREKRRLLWFTDTISDLNGPSETICRLGWLSRDAGLHLVPVVCLPPATEVNLPPQALRLPCIWSYTPSFFPTYSLHVPSLLSAMRAVCEQEPDEILISTPGVVGLLGLLVARLLHVPCRAIYHTDFTAQASLVIGDETVCKAVEEYVRWFYGLCDGVYVPTRQYMALLAERGYPASKMAIFRRGIEAERFAPRLQSEARVECLRAYGIVSDGPMLLYAGRISREKSVEFLLQVYLRVRERHPDAVLVLAGDGPCYDELRASAAVHPRVYFTGRLPRDQLPLLYAASDLLVFPSTTDTFGMVVLEAQACGLPAVVSDVGGPQEVILPGRTGYVVPAGQLDEWHRVVSAALDTVAREPEKALEMRTRARAHAVSTYDWKRVLADLFGLELPQPAPAEQAAAGVPA